MSYPTTLEGMTSKMNNLLEMREGKNKAHINKIEHEMNNMESYLVPSDKSNLLNFRSNGSIRIDFNDNEYELHPHALRQLAGRYGIPTKYAVDLAQTDWGRALLRKTFEEHKHNLDEKNFLIRTIDGQARAVLSDSFRMLDSELIYKSFLNTSQEQGAVLYDALHSDTKSYMTTIIPKVFPIETPNNGIVYSLFGSEIRNSDFGAGRLEAKMFQLNLICDNGMVGKTSLKEIHRGSKLESDFKFSLETNMLDTKTMASKVKDIISQTLSREAIIKTVELMRNASSQEIDIDKQVKKLVNSNKLTKTELEILDSKLKNNREEDGLQGKPTMWKFSQAINSVSHEVEDVRKKELDELAGEFINYKID